MSLKEKKKLQQRTDLVLGFVASIFLAFVIGVLVNVFYDVVLLQEKEVKFEDLNTWGVLFLALSIIAIVGFLQFLVEDCQNKITIDNGFIRRFFHYFFYKNDAGIVLKKGFSYFFLFYFLLVVFVLLFLPFGGIGVSIFILLLLAAWGFNHFKKKK